MTQDENKIYQIIYTGEDESDKNTKPPIEWTIEELKKRVRNADAINNYYQTDPHAFDFTDTTHENLKDGDREEKWCTCKSSDAICQMNGIDETKYEIQASDFGRVRLHSTTDEKKWKIYPLYDSVNLDKAICKDVFIKLCEKQGELRKNGKYIGYLIAKNPETENFLVDCEGYNLNVYRLVADAWLKDYICCNTKGQVHHITDDGYDNSPENLIVLDKKNHDLIPKRGTDDNYNGPRRIKMPV